MLRLHKSNNGSVPLSRPFFICGITLAVSVAIMLLSGYKALLLIHIFLFVLSVILTVTRFRYIKHLRLILIMILISAISFSFADTRVKCAFEAAGKNRYVSGTVYSAPVKNDNGSYCFTLTDCTVNDKEVPGKISVYAYNCDSLSIGDTTVFSAYRLSENANEGMFYYHSLSEEHILPL